MSRRPTWLDVETAREVVRVSLPLMFGMVGNLVMMLVDRICLARYSPETLAASGPAVFTAMTIIVFFTSTVAVSRSFIAQAHGRGDREATMDAAALGAVLAVLLAVLLALLAPLVTRIPELSGRPAEIIALESVYLLWAVRFGAVMVLNSALQSFFNGIGRTRVTMAIGILGQAVDVVLTIGLVFGEFGLPELGMQGSAIGTLIATTVMLLCYLVVVPADFYAAFPRLVRRGRVLGRLVPRVRRGVPSGASAGIDELGQTAFVWVAAVFGPVALAANNVAVSLNYVAIIPLIGLGIGCSILAGQSIGAGRPGAVLHVVNVTVGVAGGYVAVVSFLQIVTPTLLLYPFGLDSAEPATVDLAVAVSRVLWTYSVAFLFSMIGSAVLESFGLTRFAFLTRLGFMWGASVPAIVLLAWTNQGDPDWLVVIWIVGSIFEAVLGAVFFWRIRRAVRARENLLIDVPDLRSAQ